MSESRNFLLNGWSEFLRKRKITEYPCFKKYSAEVDPLDPPLKLSKNLTVFFSIGTVVPPLYNNEI